MPSVSGFLNYSSYTSVVVDVFLPDPWQNFAFVTFGKEHMVKGFNLTSGSVKFTSSKVGKRGIDTIDQQAASQVRIKLLVKLKFRQ